MGTTMMQEIRLLILDGMLECKCKGNICGSVLRVMVLREGRGVQDYGTGCHMDEESYLGKPYRSALSHILNPYVLSTIWDTLRPLISCRLIKREEELVSATI